MAINAIDIYCEKNAAHVRTSHFLESSSVRLTAKTKLFPNSTTTRICKGAGKRGCVGVPSLKVVGQISLQPVIFFHMKNI